MLKVRVQGKPEEVTAFCDALEGRCEVLDRSRPYANRGRSEYVRVYLDILEKKTGQDAAMSTS